MTTELLTERHGATLLITLSGPATRNALSTQVFAAGIETLNMAESNPDVGAVVLTGAGGHFCSGADLQHFLKNKHNLSAQGAQIDAFNQWIEALRSFPKPVIAAVEGLAAGSGLALVMACDLVVAAETARFSAHPQQTPLTPDGGLSHTLVQALGQRSNGINGGLRKNWCQAAPPCRQPLNGGKTWLAYPPVWSAASRSWSTMRRINPCGRR